MQKTSIFVNPPLEYQVYHLNGGVLELGLRPAVHVHFWVLTTGFFGLGTRSMIYAGRPKRIFICRAPTRRAVERVVHLSFGASLGGFGRQNPPVSPTEEGCRPSKLAAFVRA